MPSTAEEELAFIMTCLKYTEARGKPNFDAVSTELGIKASTCYHRHWSMLKKWGMTGSRAADAGKAVNGTIDTSAPATPVAKPKRSRPKAANGRKKKTAEAVADDTSDDGGDGEAALPKKKFKARSVDNDEDEAESVDGKGDSSESNKDSV